MENYSHEQIQYQPETGMLFEIYNTDGFFNSKHWHNGLEIIYLIAGGMTLNISEKQLYAKAGRVHSGEFKNYTFCYMPRKKAVICCFRFPMRFWKKYIQY